MRISIRKSPTDDSGVIDGAGVSDFSKEADSGSLFKQDFSLDKSEYREGLRAEIG